MNFLPSADLQFNQEDKLSLKTVAEALGTDIVRQANLGLEPELVCPTGELVKKGQNAETQYSVTLPTHTDGPFAANHSSLGDSTNNWRLSGSAS